MTITATRTCPECSVERPLHQFRRWHGAHRTLHQTCNVCHPETPIQDLPPREQERRLALRAAELRTIERHRERVAREQARRNAKQGNAMLRRHNLERIRNWNAAIADALREERNHAHSGRDRHINNDAMYHDDNPKRGRTPQQVHASVRFCFHDAKPWIAFYTQYASILDRVYEEVKSRAHSRINPKTPTEEEKKLSHYITPQEITQLKTLYIQCTPPKGVRHRTPWILTADKTAEQIKKDREETKRLFGK